MKPLPSSTKSAEASVNCNLNSNNGTMDHTVSENQQEVIRPWISHSAVGNYEAAKDPRISETDFQQQFNENDFKGHRAHIFYIDAPANFENRNKALKDYVDNVNQPLEKEGIAEHTVTAAQRVQTILRKTNKNGKTLLTQPMFSEMQLLFQDGLKFEWREAARWIKFEELVEEGGNRWSKPHVGTFTLPAVFQIRRLFANGNVLLQMEGNSFESIASLVCKNLANSGEFSMELQDKIKHVLLQPHRHQYEFVQKVRDTIGNVLQDSKEKQLPKQKTDSNEVCMESNKSANKYFMRKVPANAEASSILVGEVDFLAQSLMVFVRLKEAVTMKNLTEVPVPTRFIFITLCPKTSAGKNNCSEIGRAMATLMADEVFQAVAYRAETRDDLLAGVDEFLEAILLLPPGQWDASIRIEPPALVPTQDKRKRAPDMPEDGIDSDEEEQRLRENSGLIRTGRLFGGLINDIKRKAPWYMSDFKDGFSMQCIASWIFLYFACLSPIITFGGLLSEATGRNIATMESLVSGLICGVAYGLFAGQPLAILGSTGPVLVFESIVYDFCQTQGWDYLHLRFWIGTWIAIILMILTAFDASATVSYITRFTEENFATLIAFIFIYKAVENVALIGEKYPISNASYDCICAPPTGFNATTNDYAEYTRTQCLSLNGTLIRTNCDKPATANIFLMSIILFLGTFAISIILKGFKNALFFPTCVRQFVSDFAVIIAILTMSALDYYLQVATPKLEVPSELKPTLPSRGWFIPPFSEQNPAWLPFVAVIPALLGTILIFMDQQITAVIINRKENKLKKGRGYHLDLFILAILIEICSIMGLPWFVAATVLSLNHVNSLRKESECSAPGERPQFLGVCEQRVTQILIFSTIGLSVMLTPLLRHIPMPVLFGVFLYMGVAALGGLQFYDRILIMFMPAKYQPDYAYLRQVPISRVHLFTVIQLTCLVALWLIKSFSQTSILFPIMLVVMIGIRKALEYIFTQRELKILDDLMPGMTKKSTKSANEAQLQQNPRNKKIPSYVQTLDA